MARRRWIYFEDGTILEVFSDYVASSREARFANPLAGDRHYDGLRATDGADISSRSKHRDYMRRNNLTTVDDFKDSWAKSKAQREEHYKGGGDHKARREAVERALYENSKRR